MVQQQPRLNLAKSFSEKCLEAIQAIVTKVWLRPGTTGDESMNLGLLEAERRISGQNVLVTGAAGFIGSNLVERLVKAGAKVRAMVHYNALSSWGNLEFLPRDVMTNVEALASNVADSDYVLSLVKGQDIVLHLAALIAIPYSYVAPRSYIRANVEGTLNVL